MCLCVYVTVSAELGVPITVTTRKHYLLPVTVVLVYGRSLLLKQLGASAKGKGKTKGVSKVYTEDCRGHPTLRAAVMVAHELALPSPLSICINDIGP